MRTQLKEMFWFLGASFEMLRMSLRTHPAYFIGLVILELTKGIMPLGQAWVAKNLFDFLGHSLQAGAIIALPQGVIFLLIGQFALMLLSQSLAMASIYLNSELGRMLSVRTQVMVYQKLVDLAGLAPFENPYTYDIIQLGSQGAQMGPTQALNILTSLGRNLITLCGFLGVLLAFSPFLAGLVAVTALVQLYAQVRLGRQRFALASQMNASQRRAGYYGSLLSTVNFAKELRLFTLGTHFLRLYRQLAEKLNQVQRKQQLSELRWQSGLSLLSEMVSVGASMAVFLQAFTGSLKLGDVSLYFSALGNVQGALSGIVYAFGNIHESALFFSRYTELMALPQPIAIPAEPRPAVPLRQGIEFRKVSFRYSAEHPWVLKDVSLTIPAGSCLALVGLNGAGKTTLVKLLTRMYDPLEGQILWDGVDIRDFEPADLRRHIGAIFQDFVHYDLTAFENIALGDVSLLPSPPGRGAGGEGVLRAAQKAGIHEAITALPQGYDTVLSRWLAEEGQGADLSGGEWQKLALARLFIRESADLLILDEPTAALDAQAEYDVYSRFVDLVAGRTSLCRSLCDLRFRTASARCAWPMRLPCWKMGGLWSMGNTLRCWRRAACMPACIRCRPSAISFEVANLGFGCV